MKRLPDGWTWTLWIPVLLLAMGAVSEALAADEIHWTVTGQTSVTFDWRGSSSENTLRYGLTSSYGQTATAVTPVPLPYSSSGPFWEAKITGLQENTLYHYSIGSGADHTFRTPPPRGSSGFMIYAEGDIGDTTSYSNVGIVQPQIAANPPAFVLMVGDLTYGNAHGQAHVDQHFNDVMVWSQDAAYMPAWGNHEWDSSGDNLTNYKGRFDFANSQTSPGSPSISCCGEDWYWFDYGNVRFIASPEPWSGAIADWETKAKAIMDAAEADPAITFIVTYGHRPAFNSGHHTNESGLQGSTLRLMAAHSKYVVHLNGHSHDYERTCPIIDSAGTCAGPSQHGLVYLTVGTGGASLEQDAGGSACLNIWRVCPAPSYTAFRAMREGPLRLTFTSTGIQGQFICGPTGGGTNDLTAAQCPKDSVGDNFVIGTVSGGDTIPPTVSITAPASGSVSGTVTVSASASDNVGVVGVQFKVDAANSGSEDTTAPYSISWDTTALANGSHSLTSVARDAAGNRTTSSAVAVTVSNLDITPPTVSITAPAAGATVSATVTVTATASDNVGVAGVQFKVDGANSGAEDTTSPYSISWVTTAVANGSHSLTAVARDAAGNTTTSSAVAVTVSNLDITPPTVSITAPAAGATVSGTVTVSATASDNVGVAGVQFKVDGTNSGAEDTTSPYSISWVTTSLANGSHSLTAVARDAAGNTTTSSAVSVTVSNSSDTTPPTVSITAPAAGATVSGTVTVSATASDNVGVVGVQFKVDGANSGAEDTTSPYSISWVTTAVANGSHSLTAVARDTSGNTTTSSAVAVTVSNSGGITLVTDPNLVFSVPQVPKPFYLTPALDPTFGTTITRVANDPSQAMSWPGPPSGSGTWGSDARQHYQKDQPWNSDNTLLVLQNTGSPSVVILDGSTYQVKYGKCSNYSLGDDRWHPSPLHPHERINANGSTLNWFDVVSCTQTRSWTLPFSVNGFGSGEGNPSFDGRFALLADSTRMFVVDMDPQAPLASYASGNKRIGPAVDISGCGLTDCSLDWVSISPSGKYAVVSYNGDHPRVYDVDPATLALTPRPMPAGSPECSAHDPAQGYIYDLGHADMTLNPFDGNEDVIMGQRRSWCPSTVNGISMGSVDMVRVKDNTVSTLTDPANEASSHHISARSYDRPGWVYVGYYQASGKRFNDEIVAIKIDGSKAVERLAHKHSVFSGCYRCESHAVPSRDGKRVLFASNWAENCGTLCGSTSDIKAYVVDTRSGTLPPPDTTPPATPTNLRFVWGM